MKVFILAGVENLKRSVWIPLLILFLLNIVQSFGLNLSHDEAYYWTYANHLAWGYYDHPPMVAFFIKLGTLLFGNNEFGVRFFFNITTILSLFLAYKMTEPKNILFFSLLIFCFPLIQATGFLALPDTCVLFFSVLYFYYLKKYLEKDSLKWSLLLSLSIAGMLYSKYHAGLIIILTLISLPSLSKRKSFYTITLLSFLLFIPHLLWQYQHDWMTFKFHLFKRTEKHFDLSNIFDFLGGQLALSGLFVGGVLFYYLFKYKTETAFERVLKGQVLGFLIFLLFLSFRNKIEANWTVTIFIPLLILSEKITFNKKIVIWGTVPMIALVTILRGVLFFPSSTIPIARLDEFHGWKEASKIVEDECAGKTIVANQYQLASKFSFYLEKETKALHLNGRKSQYSLTPVKNYGVEELCYLTFNDIKNAKLIKKSYPDDVYLTYGTYEELVSLEE